MNRDLFLAILAMDSYNRGYDPGVDKLEVQLEFRGHKSSGDTILNYLRE